MTNMSGDRVDSTVYEVEVVRGVTYRNYSSYSAIEVCVEDGVISNSGVPDEIRTADEARAWAACLMAAADELETQVILNGDKARLAANQLTDEGQKLGLYDCPRCDYECFCGRGMIKDGE